MTLGEVISVTEGVQGGFPVPPPMPASRMDVANGMGGTPQIAAGS